MDLELLSLAIPTFNHWWEFVGKFHPVIIHFPIVFLSVLVLIDLFYFFADSYEFFFKFRSVVLYISILFAFVAVSTGLLASWDYPDNDLLVDHHKSLGFLSFIIIISHGVAWFYSPFRWRVKYFVGFFLLSISTMILISLTGEAGAIIVRDTTPFQTKIDQSYKARILNDDIEVRKLTSDKFGSYLRENITYSDVKEIFVKNRCATCHSEQFSDTDFKGFTKGKNPWLTLDDKGNLRDFEKSEFYSRVVLRNTMPPRNVVREEAGLSAGERLILFEWLHNNLKFEPPQNSDNEE